MTETFNTVLAERLLQMAIENQMKVGDKLPGEVELAARFKVSRVSLREAINGLKFLGILDAAPRRGTTIAALDCSRLTKYLGFQMAFSSMPEPELLEARQSIELGIMDILARRMTEEDYRELRRLADQCRRDTDEPEAVRHSIEADMLFHRRLIEITRNDLLQAFATLVEGFFVHLNSHPGSIDDSRRAADLHLMITDALHEGNVGLARGLMEKHLGTYAATRS